MNSFSSLVSIFLWTQNMLTSANVIIFLYTLCFAKVDKIYELKRYLLFYKTHSLL